MKRYVVVIEQTNTDYSAYCPVLDGCVSTGSTRAEVESNMREAIEFHLDGLREEGCPVPEPHSYSALIEVAAR